MSRERWYIVNYGTVWSMNQDTFMKFLRDHTECSAYNLDEIPGMRKLKHVPRDILTGTTDTDKWYHPNLISPLDWDEEIFREELKRRTEL